MKHFFLVCSNKRFYQNRIFSLDNPDNRDNCLFPFYLLRQEFISRGLTLDTYDYASDQHTEAPYGIIFFDFPKNLESYRTQHPNAKLFLIAYESPIKNQKNQRQQLHGPFEKVFTWNTTLVDGKKYIYLPYSNPVLQNILAGAGKKEKLCAAIFGHKLQSNPIELYSERIRAIRWFEENHPKDFGLYGAGWDHHYFSGPLFYLNRFTFLTKLLRPNFPSWRGAPEQKKDAYPTYRFAICYENCSYPDYITEKMFDCFFSGCVPVYLGAPNVGDFIPKETFIDKRDFSTYEALYEYLASMTESDYQRYLQHAASYLASKEIYPFSAEYFAKTIASGVM
jgi:hypothetical protein